MKLSQQTEAEVRQAYQAYWDAYLKGDFETFSSFLDENVVIYGTAIGEIFTTREDALNFYTATGEEMTGVAEFRNRNIRIEPLGDAVVIYDRCQLYILIEDTWTFYGDVRLTGIMQQKEKGWKLIHQHGSFPDSRTEEGKQIAAEKIKEENQQLREAIYRRTMELENKTRELEIEAALERVRTEAMGMRKPDDMLTVCESIAYQLEKLQVPHIRNVQTAIVSDSQEGYYYNYQFFLPYQKGILECVEIAKHPSVQAMIQKMQASPEAYFSATFKGEELDAWRRYRNEDHQFPDPILEKSDAVYFHFYSIGPGGLGISTYEELSADHLSLFHRFRNVFALAYQRFRDIEQAEMQAREAHIEVALEKVRSRTMAMQHSDELQEASAELYRQLKDLGEPADQLTIAIINEEEGVVEISATLRKNQLKQIVKHPISEPQVMQKLYNAWKAGEKLHVVDLNSEELVAYNQYRNHLVGENIFPTVFEPGYHRIVTAALFSKGMLAIGTDGPRPNASLQLLERFSSVFDLTYTRFLDLQKAEAQTREAKIEASLEKVRSVAMGMRKPEDLLHVCEQLYKECQSLGISSIRNAIINIHNDENRTFINYDYSPEIGRSITPLTFDIHPVIEKQIAQVRSANDAFSETSFTGEELEEWKAFRKSKGEKDDRRIDHLSGLYYYLYSIGTGSIGISTFEPASHEHVNMLKRFRNVFALAYQRYTEILFAESQTREAQIEAALERVRSRSMAMQKSEELRDVIQIVFDQMLLLNIPVEHTGFIIDYPTREDMHIWLKDKFLSPFQITIPYFDSPHWNSFLEARQKGESFFANLLDFETKNKFYTDLFKLIPTLPKDSQEAIFAKPGLAISTVLLDTVGLYIENFSGEPFTDEVNATLMRFGTVFQQSYTRFLDLQKAEQLALQAIEDFEQLKIEKQRVEATLNELKTTQSLLIHAEKMASLGELTAGIAHEIQNPLNFVNNFSEVSRELVDEMKEELDKGNLNDAQAIAGDLQQNLEKINHHGKRADAIVKGMLQHSRSSSGVKEPTDINALADEYLRLAYHGLRAKDKSFNATIKTDFDETLGKIDVIPQDIGRVLLNLITNAFHAVSAPKSPNTSAPLSTRGDLNYVPTVIVTTKLSKPPIGGLGANPSGGLGVQISVTDNGPGIPDAIKDKIFQPFFTTKPTGQGTGLGLSLSYDIVKAHGGELQVETKEGEGTTFVIQLPIQS